MPNFLQSLLLFPLEESHFAKFNSLGTIVCNHQQQTTIFTLAGFQRDSPRHFIALDE